MVTGASGFIGSHLLPQLVKGGRPVVRLARSGRSAQSSPSMAGTQVAVGPSDLARIDGWREWPDRVDALIHLAALNPVRGDSDSQDEARLMQANVEATHALARRAASEGVRRFIFLSSANVHAPKRTGAISEADEPAPQDLYASSKLAAEAAVRDALAGSGTEAVILRPVPVFGRGGRGSIAALIRLAASPAPLPIANLHARRSLLSVEGCVEAIRLAVDAPEAADRVLLLADEPAVALPEIVAVVRATLGRKAHVFPGPFGMARSLAGAFGRGAALRRVLEPFVVDASAARAALRWQPLRPPLESIRLMVESGDVR
ncbi:NAD-dependent epimerase/dehydratase family protein [Mangrovicella endophytica]|uniref:NAD-dependent epimerase/dehydratase family protein n=1 Tax=Mangrovicella endophytica TaxID=2066697 RepID=UPI001FE1691C|nr:NAD-dependent epimerase/dehydratase family protein [Mangrovicella endophytica]